MKLKNPGLFILLPLLVAWIFDYLFSDKAMGISFAIIITLIVGVGFYLAHREGIKPTSWTLVLLIPIAFFSVMTFIRANYSVQTINIQITLLLMVLLAHSFRGGKWPYYHVGHYFSSLFSVIASSLFRQVSILKDQPMDEERQQKRKLGFAILRGVLLALVVVFLLALKLGSADPIFDIGVQWVLDIKIFKWIYDHIWQGVRICFLAYLLSGIYLHAFYKNHDENISIQEGDNKKRLLGFIESTILLSAIDLLLLSFVVVQFKYFFGGDTNIHLNGLTYAEYARNGFGEMISTALITMLLLQFLYITSRRDGKKQDRIISVLGIGLVLMVGVILVSALNRLMLYEQAYGFTTDRTISHASIFWLAGLLVTIVILEIKRKQRFFALAMLLALLGYVTTINVINIDAFVAKQNVARALKIKSNDQKQEGDGHKITDDFDFVYLAYSSEDILPTLVSLYRDTPELDQELAAAIACHAWRNEKYSPEDSKYYKYIWSSFHISKYRAKQSYEDLMALPNHEDFTTRTGRFNGREKDYVMIDDYKFTCFSRDPLVQD